jgi:hypothetical protein
VTQVLKFHVSHVEDIAKIRDMLLLETIRIFDTSTRNVVMGYSASQSDGFFRSGGLGDDKGDGSGGFAGSKDWFYLPPVGLLADGISMGKRFDDFDTAHHFANDGRCFTAIFKTKADAK